MRLGLRLLVGSTALLAACNAIVGFDDFVRLEDPDAGRAEGGPQPPGPGDDGGPEADVRTPDADADAARCNPLAPFDSLVVEEGLNDVDGGKAEQAVLTLDELEIFFVRTSPAAVKTLRHGRRTDRTKPWTGTQLDVEPLSPVPTSSLSIAGGGLRLYFQADSAMNYVATRTATTQPFTSPMPYVVPGPLFVSASNDTVYGSFSSDGGETVIGRGTNTGTSATLFKAIPNIHVAGATDESPVVNASETKLYFTSSQVALFTAIYSATRPSKSAEFGARTRINELTMVGSENTVTWVSADDCELLLSRSGDVYHARRSR